MIIALFVAGWLLCSFVAYGLILGDFSIKHPYSKHVSFAVCFSMFGPMAMLAALVSGGFHWRLKPIPYEERFQIFDKDFPILGRPYFDANLK